MASGARLELGGGCEAARGGEHDLAEAVEVEVLGDHEVLRERHRHALRRLEAVARGDRKGQRRRCRRSVRGVADEHAGRRDLGQAVELRDGTDHADAIADVDVDGRVGAVEHEDAFGRQWVAVGVGVLLLEVKAVEVTVRAVCAVLEVADDHGLHGASLTGERARGAAALDLADQRGRVVAESCWWGYDDLVGCARCVDRLADDCRTAEAGDACEVEVVADPVGGRIGVRAIGEA